MSLVSKNLITHVPCKRRDLPVSTSEKSIFYYLGVNHVFFKRELRWLYFSDLEQTPVVSLLTALDKDNERKDYTLETLYLDTHHYFFGGYRLKLPEHLCKPLLVALRLKGVVISYDLEHLPATTAPPTPDNPPG